MQEYMFANIVSDGGFRHTYTGMFSYQVAMPLSPGLLGHSCHVLAKFEAILQAMDGIGVAESSRPWVPLPG